MGWVDGSEVVICEGASWNPQSALGGYRMDRLNGPKVFFSSGTRISASRKSSNDNINLLSGVFGVLVLKGRTSTNFSLSPTHVSEWHRTGYSVDELLNVMSRSIVPPRTLATWPSPAYRVSLFLFFLARRWSSSKRRDPSRPSSVYCSFQSLEGYLSLCEDLYELAFV